MFSAGQFIEQQKKVINNFLKVSENIVFSNLNLTQIFLLFFLSILARKKM